MKSSDYSKALSWYNYSLSLFPSNENKNSNIAKLQVKKNVGVVVKDGFRKQGGEGGGKKTIFFFFFWGGGGGGGHVKSS